MKKIVVILLLSTALAACSKKKEDVWQEKPVAKKVEFHVHAGRSFADPGFNQVTASINMQIYTISLQSGQSQLLWDTTFAGRTPVQYPHLPQKFVIERQFPVLESKEKLQARYSINYTSPTGTTQQKAVQECGPGETFVFLDVDV